MSRGAFLSNGVDSEFADGEEGRNQRALQAQLVSSLPRQRY